MKIKLKENKKVFFDPLTHSYWCGETELVGVTTLMKHQGLSPDYSNIDPHVLAHAAARGTAVHETLEDYDNGTNILQPRVVDDNEGGKLTIDTSKELAAYRDLGLRVLASEYLVSDNKVVASSIDKVLETDEENTVDLGDVKTTSTLHTDALEWQLSVYAFLFELQNKGVRVRNLYGIHVRDGKARIQQVRRIEVDVIKKLIKCEAKGEKFEVEAAVPELALVLQEQEISTLVADEVQLAQFEAAVKAIKDRIDERKNRIYTYMLDNNIKELKCAGGSYKLKAPTTHARLNTSLFKAEHPDLAEKYATSSVVKGSVTFYPSKD
ncbi:MAG: hypothetical protein IJK99_09485 [Bacteroidales bacterium]|nr:hypothetical protein [Bacteroidales bacterium]